MPAAKATKTMKITTTKTVMKLMKTMKHTVTKTVTKAMKTSSKGVEKAAEAFAKAAMKSTSLPKFLRDRDKRTTQPQTAKGLVRLKAEKVSIEDPKLLAFRDLAGWWSPDSWARECRNTIRAWS